MFHPQAVIFDLDGTLADSERAHERALRAAAESEGLTLDPEQFHLRFVGMGEAACFRLLADEQGLVMTDSLMARLVAGKLARFADEAAAGAITPYPGAVELVRRVGALAPVGVCSGSSRRSVSLILRALGLGDELAVVVTSGDVSNPKPDPEGYLLAAARLDIEPARCVAVEDSPTGIRAAREAGMVVVAVEHSFSVERLPGADLVVPSLAALTPEQILAPRPRA